MYIYTYILIYIHIFIYYIHIYYIGVWESGKSTRTIHNFQSLLSISIVSHTDAIFISLSFFHYFLSHHIPHICVIDEKIKSFVNVV